MTTGKMHSAKRKKFITNSAVHVILGVLAVIWVFPIVWVILTSFRAEKGSYVSTFLPQSYSLDNYIKLFTDTSILNFPQMFMNTLFIAVCSCILATFYVLAVSYCLSRLRFKLRKPYMNMAMILGLFPGFMSMVAVYFILKALGLSEGNLIKLALILVYSGGAGLGFQIAKRVFRHDPLCGGRGGAPRRMYEMADLYKDHAAAEQADRNLYDTDLLHVPMAGLHFRKGDLPCKLRPVHDRHRSVEDA